MLGLGFCRDCGFEFKLIINEPLNLFRIPCQGENCQSARSYVSIVPREFWQNFMRPQEEPKEPEPV